MSSILGPLTIVTERLQLKLYKIISNLLLPLFLFAIPPAASSAALPPQLRFYVRGLVGLLAVLLGISRESRQARQGEVTNISLLEVGVMVRAIDLEPLSFLRVWHFFG
jgi:hypothetical protein